MTSKAFGLAQLGNAFSDGALSNRNKIINGAMTIDQRNAGAAVTPIASQYFIDRFFAQLTVTSKFTTELATATPPVGFSTYLRVTSSSAYALASGDVAALVQPIEGFNCADLAWGTASAKPATLSFWVRSTLTGSFGGTIQNNGQARSYPFTYTISAANTWEYKTITIEGDTSGTWLTNNGIGVQVKFSIGTGTVFSGTAGSWSSSIFIQPTGSTSIISTSGATWDLTGVQLEAGDTATPFEHRSYGQELALCQRYYAKSYPADVVPGTGGLVGVAIGRSLDAASNYGTIAQWSFPVTMRATPSISMFNPATGAANSFLGDSTNYTSPQTIFISTYAVTANAANVFVGVSTYVSLHIVASAEL